MSDVVVVYGSDQISSAGSVDTIIIEGGIGPQGPAGPAGPAGGAEDIQRTASIPISGHRVVAADPTTVLKYASNTSLAECKGIIGITTGAASAGQPATIRLNGELTEPTWSFTPGELVYLSTSGGLTQTIPITGVLLVLGFAETANTMFIDIKSPIVLA